MYSIGETMYTYLSCYTLDLQKKNLCKYIWRIINWFGSGLEGEVRENY